MYFVWPRPCVRPSARVARWPTAGVCWRASGTSSSMGRLTSGAGAGVRSKSSVSLRVLVFSATAVLGSIGDVLSPGLCGLGRRLIGAGRGQLNRFNHLGVAGAPAQVAGETVADLLHRRLGILVEQRLGRHDDARAAEAALQGTKVFEDLLNRVQAIDGRQPFDGQ